MTTKQENRWIWYYIIFLLGVTTLPYLVGFALQGNQWKFTGFFFGVEDGNSYIAKMLSGASGAWLFQTPYTAFPQTGVLAFLPYILLGKLSALPAQHEQLVALFQLFRWGAGIAMVWATYQFMSYFLESISLRRWGLVLVTVGGGLGWLSVLGLQSLWSRGLALEFYSPETFGFLSFLGLPHLAMSRALLLWGLLFYLKNGNQKNVPLWHKFAPGLAWFGMGLMQPLTIVTGWVVLAVHQLSLWVYEILINKKMLKQSIAASLGYLKQALLMIALSSPIVLYTLLSFSIDPFLQKWSSQNKILSPPVGDYILAFGAILPFVIFGVIKLRQKMTRENLLILGWVLVFPLLAYAPYNLQRRLPDGVWVVLIIWTMIGFSFLQKKFLKTISKIWLGLSILPTIIFLIGGFNLVAQIQKPLFRPIGESSSFMFIRNTLPANTVVLAQYTTANPLPAWAPVKTVIGHGPESVGLAELQSQVDDFYQNKLTLQEQVQLLKGFNVSYILITPDEQKFNPRSGISSGYYEIVYDISGYIILRVLNE